MLNMRRRNCVAGCGLPVALAALVLISLAGPAAGQTEVGERVYVLGAFNKPGDFEYKPGMGVKEAVELAGGVAPHADPNGVLIKASGEKLPLRLGAIMDGTETVAVGPGDTIVAKPGMVRVEGEVKNPGAIDLRPEMTVRDAIAAAGGETAAADLGRILVTRGSLTIPVDLAVPFGPGSRAVAPVLLQPGDVVTVPPKTPDTASVTGEVEKPGTYEIAPDETLDALLAKAGGPTARADLGRVRISSVQGTERPTTTVNASTPEARRSIKIERGDAIFVPQAEVRRRHRISLTEVYQATIIIYTLVQIFRR